MEIDEADERQNSGVASESIVVDRIKAMENWRQVFAARVDEATQAETSALRALEELEGKHEHILRIASARRDSYNATRRAVDALDLPNSFMEAKLAGQAEANVELFQKEEAALAEVNARRVAWRETEDVRKAQKALLLAQDRRIAEARDAENKRVETKSNDERIRRSAQIEHRSAATEPGKVAAAFESMLAEREAGRPLPLARKDDARSLANIQNSGKECFRCGTALVGKQKRFCSQFCIDLTNGERPLVKDPSQLYWDSELEEPNVDVLDAQFVEYHQQRVGDVPAVSGHKGDAAFRHAIVTGRCLACGCSEDAIAHFGWACPPSGVKRMTAIRHVIVTGKCSACGCSEDAIAHFDWPCPPPGVIPMTSITSTAVLKREVATNFATFVDPSVKIVERWLLRLNDFSMYIRREAAVSLLELTLDNRVRRDEIIPLILRSIADRRFDPSDLDSILSAGLRRIPVKDPAWTTAFIEVYLELTKGVTEERVVGLREIWGLIERGNLASKDPNGRRIKSGIVAILLTCRGTSRLLAWNILDWCEDNSIS